MPGSPDDAPQTGHPLPDQQRSTPNGHRPDDWPVIGEHHVIDLTVLRRAAEADFAGAQAARRDAVDLMRRAARLAAEAEHKYEAAQRALHEATRLRDDATNDELTGAMLRRSGFAALANEVERARRSGDSLVIAFVDVDGMKEVNDTEGHGAGDELLRAVVSAVRASLRSYDVVIRFGGDEFVFSLSGATVADAERRFETVRALLGDTAPGRTVSVGFAEMLPQDDLAALVRRADDDLYYRRGRRPGRIPGEAAS